MEKITRTFTIAIMVIICCSCCTNEAEVKQQTDRKLTRKEKIADIERQLASATHGIPLSIPILDESGPAIHLIPVTENYKTIERIYVLDASDSTRQVNMSRDLFLLDSLIINDYSYRYAVVRGLSGKKHRLNIEKERGFGYQLNEIYNDPPLGLECKRIPVVEESGAAY